MEEQTPPFPEIDTGVFFPKLDWLAVNPDPYIRIYIILMGDGGYIFIREQEIY